MPCHHVNSDIISLTYSYILRYLFKRIITFLHWKFWRKLIVALLIKRWMFTVYIYMTFNHLLVFNFFGSIQILLLHDRYRIGLLTYKISSASSFEELCSLGIKYVRFVSIYFVTVLMKSWQISNNCNH
jgi:hypothetical protein